MPPRRVRRAPSAPGSTSTSRSSVKSQGKSAGVAEEIAARTVEQGARAERRVRRRGSNLDQGHLVRRRGGLRGGRLPERATHRASSSTTRPRRSASTAARDEQGSCGAPSTRRAAGAPRPRYRGCRATGARSGLALEVGDLVGLARRRAPRRGRAPPWPRPCAPRRGPSRRSAASSARSPAAFLTRPVILSVMLMASGATRVASRQAAPRSSSIDSKTCRAPASRSSSSEKPPVSTAIVSTPGAPWPPRSPRSSRRPSPLAPRRRPSRARAWTRSGSGLVASTSAEVVHASASVARVEQVEVVVDLVGLGRARPARPCSPRRAGPRAARARPRSGSTSLDHRQVKRLLGGADVVALALLDLLAEQRRDQLVAAHPHVAVDAPHRQRRGRAGGTPGTRRSRGGSWCRRACRRRRGSRSPGGLPAGLPANIDAEPQPQVQRSPAARRSRTVVAAEDDVGDRA